MMRKTNAITLPLTAGAMLLLILDAKTALLGAREGVELCIRTVIPSLLPFFLLSQLLCHILTGNDLALLRPVGRWMGIPEGAESILAVGFLGGYPTGAQCIASACRRGTLSPGDGKRMLAFCNNAGPAFLFGMAAALFPRRWMAWALWGIHILSAILTARFIPGKGEKTAPTSTEYRFTVPDGLKNAIWVLAQVCGWVILFRVIIAFLARWFGWLLPESGQIILSGILELSNGCCMLHGIEQTGLRFVLCAGFLGFGGLCVGLQTLSVAAGLDTSLYFPGKLLQTLFSLLLATLVQCIFPAGQRWDISPLLPAAILSAIVLLKFLPKTGIRAGKAKPSGV